MKTTNIETMRIWTTAFILEPKLS